MADTLRVAAVQINTQHDKAANLKRAGELIDEAASYGARLVALPEYVAYLGPKEDHEAVAEDIPGPTSEFFGELARRHAIYILGGSIHEKSPDPGKFYNTSVLFGPDGNIIARYRKIHLFDVETPNGVRYRESDQVGRGREIVTYRAGGRVVGAAICYDLRFAELFRALRDRGAEIIVLPAAFTLATGKDHWEVLIRARAIETQTYFAAAAQIGTHPRGKSCWGHSMIVDPWGSIVAQASDREGHATARCDFAYLQKVRDNLPVATHHVL